MSRIGFMKAANQLLVGRTYALVAEALSGAGSHAG